jgi:hypothetical protein
MSKTYRVKGREGLETYIEVLKERGNGYDVRITTIREYSTTQTDEHVSTDLLDSCLRTGYIEETTAPAMAG